MHDVPAPTQAKQHTLAPHISFLFALLLAGLAQRYAEKEAEVFNSFLRLIRDSCVLRDYAALALAILQVCVAVHASGMLGSSLRHSDPGSIANVECIYVLSDAQRRVGPCGELPLHERSILDACLDPT